MRNLKKHYRHSSIGPAFKKLEKKIAVRLSRLLGLGDSFLGLASLD
jgi:hypothetical protein